MASSSGTQLGELTVGATTEYAVVGSLNWKLIYENFQECYHCRNIHPELVTTIPQFWSPAIGTEWIRSRWLPDRGWPGVLLLTGQTVLPRLPGLLPADDRPLRHGGAPELLSSRWISDHAIVHRLEPVAPDRTLVVCEWLFPADTVQAGRDVADAVALLHKVNDEDFAAAQWCQPNMSSRALRAAEQAGAERGPGDLPLPPAWYTGLMGDTCAAALPGSRQPRLRRDWRCCDHILAEQAAAR